MLDLNKSHDIMEVIHGICKYVEDMIKKNDDAYKKGNVGSRTLFNKPIYQTF